MRLRRFSRFRKRRSRYRHRKSRFTRRVQRAEVTNSAVKKALFTQFTGSNLAQGDATGRELIIWSPLTNLIQGTGVQNFIGRSIWPRGIQLRGSFTVPAAVEFQNAFARFTFFWSRSQADYFNGLAGGLFNSTTRAAAGPTQVPPFANPRIFDDTTFAYTPFVGTHFGTQFDNTNIKVLSTRTIAINSISTPNGVKLFKLWFRFPKRSITWNDPAESPLTSAPNFPLTGNYYIILQIFSSGGTGNISSTTQVIMDITGHIYWKDISG